LAIAEEHASEAGYRTAIGRVYYACHLVGCEATSKKGWFDPKHSREDHSGLARALDDQGKKILSSKLRDLAELREHADYHTTKRANGRCHYCDDVADGGNLVKIVTWERAKTIAANILPKLEAIRPS